MPSAPQLHFLSEVASNLGTALDAVQSSCDKDPSSTAQSARDGLLIGLQAVADLIRATSAAELQLSMSSIDLQGSSIPMDALTDVDVP